MQDTLEDVTRAIVRRKIEELIGPMVQEQFREFTQDENNANQVQQIVTDEAKKALAIQRTKEPQFKDVSEFVDRFIRPMYPATAATMSRTNWSARWYKHPEVMARLETLWFTYEAQRRTGGKAFLEGFLRVHCDYHMREIMRADGVFAECSTADVPSVPLPTDPSGDEPETTNETER